MQTIQIKCIRKCPAPYGAYQRITHIGGITDAGKRWQITEDDAIRMILRGEWSFWVSVNGRRVDVIIATHSGRQYLKTTADGYAPNNLLALPECP